MGERERERERDGGGRERDVNDSFVFLIQRAVQIILYVVVRYAVSICVQ